MRVEEESKHVHVWRKEYSKCMIIGCGHARPQIVKTNTEPQEEGDSSNPFDAA